MATKSKSPPKINGADVLAMLKLTKSRDTKGYGSQMSNLLSFLHLTNDIRLGAEVVEHDLNIEHSGSVVSPQRMRQDFINSKMSSVHFHVKEEKQLEGSLNEIHKELYECGKIIRSNAKVNTDEKKEKAQKKIDELQVPKEKVRSELNELRKQIEALKAAERKKLEATDFPIQTMREKLELLPGVKIKIDLTTGSYSFPVLTGTPFYNEVCRILGLPFENQVVEKPVVKRMFTMPAAALDAMRKAIRFVSNDDLRPPMMCVCLEIKDGKMLVVATDAHRLYKSVEFDVAGPSGEYTYLLYGRDVAKLPQSTKEDFIMYVLKDGLVSLFDKLMTPLDERFPDWKVVMPKYKESISFNRVDMIGKVKEVLPYANKCTAQVTFSFNGDITLASQDIDFYFESIARMNYIKKTMEDLVIGFNGKFIIDALKVFKSEHVKFLGSTSTKPAILTDGGDTILIMPLMINC